MKILGEGRLPNLYTTKPRLLLNSWPAIESASDFARYEAFRGPVALL